MKQHYCQIFIFSIFFFCLGNTLSAQCPDLTSEGLGGADCTIGTTPCDVCAGDEITFTAEGTSLPDGGTLDWYYSTNPSFNPYNGEGTFMGSADISTPSNSNPCVQCPELLGLMVDACSGEDNEFMIMASGSGFLVDDLTVDFPTQNDGLGSVNDDINFPGGSCTWAFPDVSLINGTGCNNVVAAGPGTIIPENAVVIIFVSAGATTTFDFSSLCITGATIYVMQNTCDRLIGAFSNGSANGIRTITTGLMNCACADDMITYNTASLTSSADGDYVIDIPFFPLFYGNSGCNFPMGVVLPPNTNAPMSTIDPLPYTVQSDMCNGGPYYAIGILNPAPIVPCTQEMTQPVEFNVICPIANPITTQVCLNPSGNTFLDLTQFESAIAGGSGLSVTWYADPAGMNPVPPPLSNALVDPNEPNFYVTLGSGSCLSPLQTFTVNTLAGPDISNLTFDLSPMTGCGPTDLEVVFTYPGNDAYDVTLNVGNSPVQTLNFSVLSGVPVLIGNFNQSVNVELVSVGFSAGNGCATPLSPNLVESFTYQNPPASNTAFLNECIPNGGTANFDLTTAINNINGNSGLLVTFYTDVNASNQILDPENFTTNTPTAVYAVVGMPPCTSSPAVVQLTINNFPNTSPATLESCDDGNGNATFDLTSIENIVNTGNGNSVMWYETNNTSFPINNPTAYIFSGGSVFATVFDGQCTSDFVEVTLNITMGGMPVLGTTTLCEADGLYDLTQLEDSTFPNGNWNGNGVSGDFFDPSGQIPSATLTFTPIGDCDQAANTTITINTASSPALLTANICETDGTLDLNTLVIDNTLLPGTWTGNGVQADGMTFDPIGQSSPVTVTFASDADCTNPTTTTVSIQSVNMLVLATGETCESDGLFDLNDLLLTNTTTGTWTGTGVQADGFNFNPVGLLGPNTVTFTPNENCTSGGMTLVNVFGDAMMMIVENYCSGSGNFIQVGTDIYDEFMPTGTTTLQTFAGCDSIVNVNLTYATPQQGTYTNTLCPGNSETIGGILFDENMPTGLATLQTPAGCDSMVMVTLTFANEVTNNINETYCSGSGDFVQVGTDTYDETTPTGTTTLQTFAGCDSIVNVNLTYAMPPQGTYTNTLCSGNSETIGGIVFDQNMPNGIATLQTPDGCDSMVMVTLTFANEVTNNINETFCSGSGDFIQVGTDTYNETTPTGTTTLQTVAGCDSIVNVNLTYAMPPQGTYTNTLCSGNSETIGGIVFDQNMPNGIATLQTPAGCDSMVMVTLTFANEVTNNINETYCSGSGDFVQVGTDTYDETTPTGTTTLQTFAGCDSIVNVNLNFITPQQGTYTNTLCPGNSETIGGIVFNENMPTGIATLQTPDGCDSMVMVTLTFANEVTNNINETYCSGSGDFVQVGSDIYDEILPIGQTTLQTFNGCDSIVNVNLNFITPQQGTYTNTLCPGNSETIGGIVFNENMPTGIATLQTPDGCDSMVMVTLTFANEVTNNINETYCSGSGDFVQVGSDIYDEILPIGQTTLQTFNGCDSIVNVNLNFITPQQGTYTNTLCPGNSETIGGIVFNENMPTGIATLQTPDGCDSMVMVTLTFANEVTNNINETYCSGSGDFVQVGSDIYDEILPIGQTTLQTFNGCDSIVNVNLTFVTPQQGTYENTFCPGGSITIGGIVFDENMPTGIATLQTPDGCDSMVMVTLTFANEVTNNINETYCSGSGDFIQVGSDIYDETNPSGTTTLQTPAGCDSIVNVNLNFITTQQGTYTNTFCPGGSITIGGMLFDENMPTGIAVVQTPEGCDSTVMVTLTFANEVTNNINEIYCSGSGDFVEVGTDFYDENMPTGTTTLQTVAGCDSIVNVNLNFITPQQGTYTNTLCPGNSETIGGIVFNENMPTGIATLQTLDGCDSMVMVTLTFANEVTNNINEIYCSGSGDFIQVGSDIYDEAIPTGTTTLQTFNGCDSTINVNLMFTTPQQGTYENTFCPGGSITIGGIVFDENMPTGIATLQTPEGCDSTVMVTLTFANEVTNNINEIYCSGSGDFIQVGSDIYDEINPLGTTTLQTPAGCDSIVNVNLNFTSPQQGTYQNTFCPGGSINIGGTLFDENMPTGIATLQTPEGCDSTVMVTLTFANEVTNNINEIYCSGSGDFIQVGSDIYDEAIPTGTTTLQTFNGCDSTINVNLMFTTPQQGTYENTFCPGGSITIGGTLFDENMPTGIAVVQTPDGCDSTVIVTLTFANEVTNNINETYCSGSGDFVQVGSDIYDEINPSGTTTLQTPAGCDSIVNVNLNFITTQQGTYTNTFCPGGSITIGGILFDENMPTGITTLQTPEGCDSTVIVTLTFANEVTNNINEIYCSGSGDFVQVGSDIYDETNPSGTTTLQTPAGCDSIVNVNLNFITTQQGTYTNTFCPGGSITIGGMLFDENMPTGIAVVQTPEGCDSTVMVTLTFANEVTNNINEIYCSGSGDFIQVGSDIYDEINPSGTTTLQTPAGCDSIVNVNLNFITTQQGTYTNTFCPGGSITIGGMLFDENMPIGIAVVQTPEGCDSTVMVTLTFENDVVGNISETLCPGESLIIDGVTYDENNPTGVTTIPNGSYLGCDSTTNVSIGFYPIASSDFTATLNIDETIEIGGVTFSVDNPSGAVTLPMSSINGCDSTINVSIQFTTTFAVEISAFPPFCANENTGGITIDTIENVELPISVSLNGNSMGSFPAFPIEISELAADFYTLDFIGNNGAETTVEIVVPNAPILTLDIGNDETIRLGEIIELSGQSNANNVNWLWIPSLFLECDTCITTLSTPLESTTYTLIGTTPEGCTVSDNLTISVERGDAIFAPNVFSPNDDGVNDMFYIHATSEVSIIRNFRIFDRWGALVFDRSEIQPNDPLMGWSGIYKGKVVEQGVYVFFAEIELVDGQIEMIKGGVTVMR